MALGIRESLDFLGEITGETVTEDILADIFSRFCLGKWPFYFVSDVGRPAI